LGRPHRPIGEGTAYHIVGKGNNDGFIFENNVERREFLSILEGVVRTRGWEMFAYCVMGNHYHLAFLTPEANLSDGMRDLMGHYARWRNATRGRKGHAFGSRYHSTLIESDSHLLAVVRYIAVNPVQAGLAPHAGEWPWGSYHSLCAGHRSTTIDITRVLGLFHRSPARARDLLRHFVESAPADHLPVEPTPLTPQLAARRPSIRSVFALLLPTEATRACSRLGYANWEIAASTGVTRSTVTRRLRHGSSP
jgi:REP element-mobilizing transposase RayT